LMDGLDGIKQDLESWVQYNRIENFDYSKLEE